MQQQGRGGTGRDKPWQQQQGYDQKELLQATLPMLDQIQNTSYTSAGNAQKQAYMIRERWNGTSYSITHMESTAVMITVT